MHHLLLYTLKVVLQSAYSSLSTLRGAVVPCWYSMLLPACSEAAEGLQVCQHMLRCNDWPESLWQEMEGCASLCKVNGLCRESG